MCFKPSWILRASRTRWWIRLEALREKTSVGSRRVLLVVDQSSSHLSSRYKRPTLGQSLLFIHSSPGGQFRPRDVVITSRRPYDSASVGRRPAPVVMLSWRKWFVRAGPVISQCTARWTSSGSRPALNSTSRARALFSRQIADTVVVSESRRLPPWLP